MLLRFALLAAVFALGCTTSFDLGQLGLADTGADASVTDVSNDLGPDVALDAPTVDLPSTDAGPSCGASGRPCCEGDGGARCGPSLVCSQGACVPCPAGLTACGDLCVDPAVSVAHCGGCGNRCPDGQECRGGSCRLNCPAPLVACDGRCVAVLSDPAHCGGCATTCEATNAVPRCADGACVTACAAGYGDCDAAPGNGCEVDLNASADHCGACGQRCAFAHASAACAGGTCALGACDAGYGDCDADPTNGCETDLRASVSDCGACHRACRANNVCRSGECAATAVTCDPGTGNCDGDDANRCEVDLNTSAEHCGACGRACAPPNATPRCDAGACGVSRCDLGYGDCDGNPANGCEVNLESSTALCGGCGRACAPANATARCAMNVCGVDACAPGFGDCDASAANGCETNVLSSAANCGGCGAACALPHATPACAEGRCAVGACEAGWGDCDANPANGCETNLSTSGGSCGFCGNVCSRPNATTQCVSGACAFTGCAAGYGNCDGTPANGCETDTRSSNAHCGACGVSCARANATTQCVGGACSLVACAAGYGNCDGDAANGCETDLASSGAHCGGCGNVCPPGRVCQSGACVTSCQPGQTACGAACVDTQSDPSHCGACGRVCPSGPRARPACAAGQCRLDCEDGFGNCDENPANGCETNLSTSVAHCGRCNVACPAPPNATPYCSESGCRFACAGSFRDCDGAANNGCESNPNNDPMNCGACGVRCPVMGQQHHVFFSAGCSEGACRFVCMSGWADCDGDPSNGCEASLTATTSCGGCGRVCANTGRDGGGSAVCCAPLVFGGSYRCCPEMCSTLSTDARCAPPQ
ncbi:MAG: hypothetical protein R3A52_31360 [Polyangiales bacterium]